MARATYAVLQSRGVALSDVLDTLEQLELAVVREIASRPNRVRSLATLRLIADAQRASFEKKAQFGVVNASFHRTLVKLADSDTMVVGT